MPSVNPRKLENAGPLVPAQSKVVKMLLTSRMVLGAEHQKEACEKHLLTYMDYCPGNLEFYNFVALMKSLTTKARCNN